MFFWLPDPQPRHLLVSKTVSQLTAASGSRSIPGSLNASSLKAATTWMSLVLNASLGKAAAVMPQPQQVHLQLLQLLKVIQTKLKSI